MPLATHLTALATQLESRMVDPLVIAKQLREVAGKVEANDALVADLVLEFRATSECRGRLHANAPCDCRPCSIARRLK